MKKLIYCALALAAGLFAASCQQENLEAVKGGSTVTFTVEVPEAVATKAAVVENGENINNLVYAVYRTTESSEDAFKKLNPELFVYGVNPVAEGKTTVFADNKTTISLELINNQKYVVLFWAQVDQTWIEGAIGESSLTAISYPERLFANDSKYAAFSGVAFVEEVKGSRKESVTLTRPFAQINLATNNPERYDVDVTASSVKIDNAAATFNVATQQASGTRTVEYESATNPDGTFNGYDHYVAMNYIFANPKGENSQTVSVTCVMDTENHGTDIEKIISNVPVAQNYKTNIVGNLLTSDVEYTVELNDNWVDGYIVSPEGNVTQNTFVESASEIQDIIGTLNEDADVTSAMITLNEDINLYVTTRSETSAAPSFTIKSGNTLTIDLNGHILTGVDNTQANFGLITNQGNLTIVNSAAGKTGKIHLTAEINNGWNRYSSVISTQPGSTLTVGAGVEIEHFGGTDMSYGIDILTNGKGTSAVAVIDGATVKSTYRAIRQFLNGTEANNSLTVKSGSEIKSTSGNKSIWMQDPSKSANSGSLVVEEGAKLMTDVYLDVTEGSTEWPVSVSIAASALQDEATVVSENVPAGYKVEIVDGVWTVYFHTVAMIGETGYWSLNAAVAAVEDGQTITLVANEMFTENNYFDNGGWKDGLGYAGDKSFTIDLGGHTISQNGALNDYLVWIKNVGSKENTITFKNGTMDAGKTAYCALCTASSHENKLTVNLENITLINEHSNGSTVKIRTGSELNVKAGTKIIGNNSYLGVENWKAVVNIYDGAEIYMNGTSSYNGCLVGVGGNGTINVYGGYGKGVKGGFIAMTSGGTINVAGGEWIANTNGTVGDNSNLYVLTAQSNKYESGFAGPSIINVTGGTLRGGMDAWVLNNLPEEKAELNISGGNFNANPTSYLGEGYKANEDNGVWTVIVDPDGEGLYKNDEGVWVVLNAKGLAKANAMMLDDTMGANAKLALAHDIDFAGKTWTPVDSHVDFGFYISEINGNGHTISNLTINGQAMFTRFAGPGEVLVTIKNITFDNAKVNSNGSINTAILTGHTYQNVLLENVDVKNSSITGGYKVAPLIGTVYNETSTTITATLKNCDVENVTVKATSYDFCTTGMVSFVYEGDNDRIQFENCSVKNVKLYAPNVYTAHANVYTAGSETLYNEVEGVAVENVTFENI